MSQRQIFVDEEVNQLNSYIHYSEERRVEEKLKDNLPLLMQTSMVDFGISIDDIDKLRIFTYDQTHSAHRPKIYRLYPLAVAFGMANESMCNLLIKHFDQLGTIILESGFALPSNMLSHVINPILDQYADLLKRVGASDHQSLIDDFKIRISQYLTKIFKSTDTFNHSHLGLLGAAIALAELDQAFPHGPGVNPLEDARKIADSDSNVAYKLEQMVKFRLSLHKRFDAAYVQSYNEKFIPELSRCRKVRVEQEAIFEKQRAEQEALEKKSAILAEFKRLHNIVKTFPSLVAGVEDEIVEKTRLEVEAKEKAAAEEKIKAEAAEKARLEALAKAKAEAEAKEKARIEAQAKEKARLETEAKAKAEAEKKEKAEIAELAERMLKERVALILQNETKNRNNLRFELNRDRNNKKRIHDAVISDGNAEQAKRESTLIQTSFSSLVDSANEHIGALKGRWVIWDSTRQSKINVLEQLVTLINANRLTDLKVFIQGMKSLQENFLHDGKNFLPSIAMYAQGKNGSDTAKLVNDAEVILQKVEDQIGIQRGELSARHASAADQFAVSDRDMQSRLDVLSREDERVNVRRFEIEQTIRKTILEEAKQAFIDERVKQERERQERIRREELRQVREQQEAEERRIEGIRQRALMEVRHREQQEAREREARREAELQLALQRQEVLQRQQRVGLFNGFSSSAVSVPRQNDALSSSFFSPENEARRKKEWEDSHKPGGFFSPENMKKREREFREAFKK